MRRIWGGLRQRAAVSRVGLICLLLAIVFYCLDGFIFVMDNTSFSFSASVVFSFPLVWALARRIALDGQGTWAEKLAIPLIIAMSLTVLQTAIYAIDSTLLWFTLSYIAPSLLYFGIILFHFCRRRARFRNGDGKLKDSFYVLKTAYAFLVWLTAIGMFASGGQSYLPVLIALSFASLPPYLAVLSIEMLLRKPRALQAEDVSGASRSPHRRILESRALCLSAAAVSALAIGSQFHGADELLHYVPDHPSAWVGWLSIPMAGLLLGLAVRPGAKLRWLAILFVYVWVYYGHYSLNANYSGSPSQQVVTLAVMLPIYGVLLFAVLWRSRALFLDGNGRVNDYFEYIKSLVMGSGWMLATVVVLVLNRLHQSTLSIAVWGGLPLSVAVVLIVLFGYESLLRWRAFAKPTPHDGQAPSSRNVRSPFRHWLAPVLLLVGLPPSVLYVLTKAFGTSGRSPVVFGLLILPFFIAWHMVWLWSRRRELLHRNGKIGEGFQYYKAATACLTWLLGTLSLILLKVWLVSGHHQPALIVTAVPLAIAPLVSGLYAMETWFRTRSGRS